MEHMSDFKPLPYEIRKPILSYLRKTGQMIAYTATPHLVQGRISEGDIERAWYAGAIAIDDAGLITVCGISCRASIDTKKIRNQLVNYLRGDAPPIEVINAATLLGIGL